MIEDIKEINKKWQGAYRKKILDSHPKEKIF